MSKLLMDSLAEEHGCATPDFLVEMMRAHGSVAKIAQALEISGPPVSTALQRHGWKRRGVGLRSEWVSPGGERFSARTNLERKLGHPVKRTYHKDESDLIPPVINMTTVDKQALEIIQIRTNGNTSVRVKVNDINQQTLNHLVAANEIEFTNDSFNVYARLLKDAPQNPKGKPQIDVAPYTSVVASPSGSLTDKRCGDDCIHARILNLLKKRSEKFSTLIDSLEVAEELLQEMFPNEQDKAS